MTNFDKTTLDQLLAGVDPANPQSMFTDAMSVKLGVGSPKRFTTSVRHLPPHRLFHSPGRRPHDAMSVKPSSQIRDPLYPRPAPLPLHGRHSTKSLSGAATHRKFRTAPT